MTRTVVFDVDDVLVAWREAFYNWMKENGHAPAIAYDADSSWSMLDSFPQFDMDGLRVHIRAFNCSRHYGELPVVPHAEEAVARLRAILGPSSRFVAVTATGSDPETRAMRRLQLRRFGLDEVRFVNLGHSKMPHLEELQPDLIVDDSPSVIKEALASGMPILAKDAVYNRHFTALGPERRLFCWKTCFPKVLRMLDLPTDAGLAA